VGAWFFILLALVLWRPYLIEESCSWCYVATGFIAPMRWEKLARTSRNV